MTAPRPASNTNPSDRPIAMFDSGFGGLTVARAVIDLLPDENLVYLGDTARVPYGTKSPETVIRYAREASRFLRNHDVKLTVVACNTASSVARFPAGRMCIVVRMRDAHGTQ